MNNISSRKIKKLLSKNFPVQFGKMTGMMDETNEDNDEFFKTPHNKVSSLEDISTQAEQRKVVLGPK